MGVKEDILTDKARKKGAAVDNPNTKYPDAAAKSAAQDRANNAAADAYEARKAKGYAAGGTVSRGAGAATRGIKFKGCK